MTKVKNMDKMFHYAASFKQELCGAAWVHSKATKNLMFGHSPGSISQIARAPSPPVFSPESKKELKSAVDGYLTQGDGSTGRYGPIGEWDVTRVTDMSSLFFNAKSFNGDISKWDVSRVTDMNRMFYNTYVFNSDLSKWDVSSVKNMGAMFYYAAAFNHDLSKWDVSSVEDMDYMFFYAVAFKQKLCGAAWVNSDASKSWMFGGIFASGSISQEACASDLTPAITHATTYYVHVAHTTSRPLPERELIVRTPITTSARTSAFASTILNTMICSKCGTFARSGRVSCCAPGGAWYKNCGGSTLSLIHI